MALGRNFEIICFDDESLFKGLNWSMERYPHSLDGHVNLRMEKFFDFSQTQPDAFDAYVFVLDFGQPLPLEHLKKLSKVRSCPGICLLQQPSPAQLMDIFKVPMLGALEWDGVSFDRVVAELSQRLSWHDEQLRSRLLVDQLQAWVQERAQQAARLEWLPPPGASLDAQLFGTYLLDPARSLSFGGRLSRCDLRLPIDSSSQYGTLDFISGAWIFEASEDAAKEKEAVYTSRQGALYAGDELHIHGHSFLLKSYESVEHLSYLMRQEGFFDETFLSSRSAVPEKSLQAPAELIRKLMQSMSTGELRLSSGNRFATLYFSEGCIEQVLAGSVAGKKALLRVLGWENVQWTFNRGVRIELKSEPLLLRLAPFVQLWRAWKQRWEPISQLAPPLNIDLGIKADLFFQQNQWSVEEAKTLAAVAEYSRVREVFNHCPLQDVEVAESLVSLRKKGIVEVLTQNR